MSNDEINRACAEKLLQLPLRDYVAVVGCGPSHDIATGLNGLIEKMENAAKLVRVKTDSGQEAQWEFFDRVYNKDRNAYHGIIKESFEVTRPFEGLAYKYLVNIKFRSFVTFNADECLPNAYQQMTQERGLKCLFNVYPGSNPIFLPADFSADNPCLVAVHGCKNRDDPKWYEKLIVRGGDYKLHYEGSSDMLQPPLYMWWYWLLTTWPCLFIGTSLQEPGLQGVITDIRSRNSSILEKLKHIHLTAELTKKPFGIIEQFIYDKIDDDHIGLVSLLSQVSGIGRSGPPITKLRRAPINTSFPIQNEDPSSL